MGMLVLILVMSCHVVLKEFQHFSSPSQSINSLKKLLIVRHNSLISGLRPIFYRLKPFGERCEGIGCYGY